MNEHFKAHWEDDLNSLQPIVSQSLAHNPDNRPQKLSPLLQQVFGTLSVPVMEWLKELTGMEVVTVQATGK